LLLEPSMHPTLVLLAVGLTPRHLGPHTPNLSRLASAGGMRPLDTITPAVTCSVQASFMTGLLPREHGVVANGWLFRDLMEIWFWRQSNRLVGGEKIWEAGKARDPSFTCANLFWWYNMAASFEIGATPRPIYKADGRKLPDCYTKPAALREALTAKLGPFPLFQFWGPGTSIASSRWIAQAAKHVIAAHRPTLTLVYLPHLDYDLQRHGPDEAHPAVAQSLRDLDGVAGDLLDAAQRGGLNVIVLSEYGITPVDTPVHPNRALREAGFLAVREEDGAEMLDPVASRAFAVCDHQVAHVYVAEPALKQEFYESSGGWTTCWMRPASALTASTIRARGNSWRWLRRTPGSAITTGSTPRARPTSPAPSRYTASPATTRSSFFSIPRSVSPSSRSAPGSPSAASGCAR
jgi:predicted AlkP superfamily pyrophosphatase or phosphodiesterase